MFVHHPKDPLDIVHEHYTVHERSFGVRSPNYTIPNTSRLYVHERATRFTVRLFFAKLNAEIDPIYAMKQSTLISASTEPNATHTHPRLPHPCSPHPHPQLCPTQPAATLAQRYHSVMATCRRRASASGTGAQAEDRLGGRVPRLQAQPPIDLVMDLLPLDIGPLYKKIEASDTDR